MEPLANKIRPKTLGEFVGQVHLVGPSGPMREAVDKKHLFSFILWGPPGVGKTTLARIYANALHATLFELSAVSAGKADIKKLSLKHSSTQNYSFSMKYIALTKHSKIFYFPMLSRVHSRLLVPQQKTRALRLFPHFSHVVESSLSTNLLMKIFLQS